eukprot:m51a1_g9658 hypothetical protein (596) ;mRNA; f:1205385-1209209
MVDAGDLCSLAQSFAAALCSPCFLRIAQLCSTPSVPPTEALLLHLATQTTSRPLEELARRVGGARAAHFARELARPPFGVHKAAWDVLVQALRMACQSGSGDAVGVLGAAPYLLSHEYAVAGDKETLCAFAWACKSGSADVVDALARPPYNVCRQDLLDGESEAINERALAYASDSVGLLDVLASPPYSLTGDHFRIILSIAIKLASNSCYSLVAACDAGSLEVVEALAESPFSLTHNDALQGDCAALKPFYLGHWDASRNFNLCLFCACLSGDVDTLSPLMLSDRNLRNTVDTAVGTADRQFLETEKYVGGFICSGGLVSCATCLLSEVTNRTLRQNQVSGRATSALNIISKASERWGCPDLPDLLPGVLVACSQIHTRTQIWQATLLAVLRRVTAVSPGMTLLVWRAVLDCCTQKPLHAAEARTADWNARQKTKSMVLSLLQTSHVDSLRCSFQAQLVATVVFWMSQSEELAPVLRTDAVFTVASEAYGQLDAAQLERVPPDVLRSINSLLTITNTSAQQLPESCVSQLMTCAASGEGRGRMVALHALCVASARAGRPDICDKHASRLYERLRDWDFSQQQPRPTFDSCDDHL